MAIGDAVTPSSFSMSHSRDDNRAEQYHRTTWWAIFKKFDRNQDGYIPIEELQACLTAAPEELGLSHEQRQFLLSSSNRNKDRQIDFEEFCFLMTKIKHLRARNAMFRAAQVVLPKTQRLEKFDELSEYNCFPPPVFLLLITVVEVAVYIYYVVSMKSSVNISGPVPIQSPLIYNPYRRYEVWRFITYMFIHVGIYHILFNALAQIVLGIPLELVHKYWRIGLVYVIGVIAGSLAVSVCDPYIFLAGASGGVYALIAAHIAQLVVNWAEMEYAIFRLIFVLILVGADFGVALYNRYAGTESEANRVSYVAHIGGFVSGLLMGIVVLRNFRQMDWERVVWWIALVGFLLMFALCVFWNIFYPQYPASNFD